MSKPINILLILFFGLYFLVPTGNAQNPFDFVYRLPKLTQDSLNRNTNPFDITNKHEVKARVNIIDGAKDKKMARLQFNHTQVPSQYLFWIYFSMAVFIAVITSISRSVFTKIGKSVTNTKQLGIFQREVSNFYLVPMVLLYIFWIFNLALFVYFFCHYYSVPLFAGSVTGRIFQIFGIISLLWVARHLVWLFIAWVFPVGKEMNQYHFMLINYHIIIGLLLLPINLFLGYIPINYVQFFLVLGLILVLSVFAIRFVAGALFGSKYIFSSNFHFLLYLCTIEIAPILVLWKLIIVLTGF